MTARQQLDLLNRGTTDAAEYLFKIKDIRDELNILKTIAKSHTKFNPDLPAARLDRPVTTVTLVAIRDPISMLNMY
jgi:hypothetical protein